MLQFINDSDFLKVDTFKENENGSVSWSYKDKNTPHSGLIYDGFTRTDDDGNVIDVWQKLLDKEQAEEIYIQRLTQEDRDALTQQEQVAQFKHSRQQQLDSAVVTTSSSNQYDADETSISRMTNAILAAQEEGVTELQWSLADTGTGVMTTVTLADVKEAQKLAVQQMANIWSVE